MFEKETEYGHIEYKRYFNRKDNFRIQKYISQLKFRLIEGENIAIYIVGVNDDGSIYGLNEMEINNNYKLLSYMCTVINAKITLNIICNYKNKKFFICKIKLKS